MKTLSNQTLLYDEDCPLCQAYTSAFVKTGMLDKHGRMPYSSLSETVMPNLDIERAANEIALVDHTTQTVTYGVDSLLKVLGNSIPVIATIGNIKPVKYFLKKLYSFISYNRKVIIPGRKKQQTLQCEPAFNFRYRIAFVLFALIITTATLYNYSNNIDFLSEGRIDRELTLAFGQILFQGIFLLKHTRQTVLNYIGNLMTISLGGSLLLLPMLLANNMFNVPQYIIEGWFALTALLMFIEHYRRVKLLELSALLCYTWAAYRLIVLIIILNF